MLAIALKTFLVVTTTLAIEQGYKNIKELVNSRKQNPCVLRCGDVTFDFSKSPHLLVGGLSNMGKTVFCETLLRGREDINVCLLNSFTEDFRGVKAHRYNNTNHIVTLLSEVSSGQIRGTEDKPLYIVIDELLELTLREKTIGKLLQRAMTVARHYYVYFIVIVQEALKEVLSSKSLFNMRVCFGMVDPQSYSVVLGYNPDENKLLKQREYFFRTHERMGRATVPQRAFSHQGTGATD